MNEKLGGDVVTEGRIAWRGGGVDIVRGVGNMYIANSVEVCASDINFIVCPGRG